MTHGGILTLLSGQRGACKCRMRQPQAVRQCDRECACAGLRIKENKEVYEGEVTELTPEETLNQAGGYGKVISHVVIGLRTVKGTKQLKLDPTIYDRRAGLLSRNRIVTSFVGGLGMCSSKCRCSSDASVLSSGLWCFECVNLVLCYSSRAKGRGRPSWLCVLSMGTST